MAIGQVAKFRVSEQLNTIAEQVVATMGNEPADSDEGMRPYVAELLARLGALPDADQKACHAYLTYMGAATILKRAKNIISEAYSREALQEARQSQRDFYQDPAARAGLATAVRIGQADPYMVLVGVCRLGDATKAYLRDYLKKEWAGHRTRETTLRWYDSIEKRLKKPEDKVRDHLSKKRLVELRATVERKTQKRSA